jgi:hypothetical protein
VNESINEELLLTLRDIINAKNDIKLIVKNYGKYTLVKINDEKLGMIFRHQALKSVLAITDSLREKLNFKISTTVNEEDETIITITKPENWNESISITPLFMYTKNDIEAEYSDYEYTGYIVFGKVAQTDVIITFRDKEQIPTDVRLQRITAESDYGTVTVTNALGELEVKPYDPHNINFKNIEKLKKYKYITNLMELIASYMQQEEI